MSRPHAVPRRAVTLVEMVVVIGLLGVLASLVLPAVQGARAAAVRAACQNNLRQVALAAHHYAGAKGGLPPAAPVYFSGPRDLSTKVHVWGLQLAPYIEQGQLWSAAQAAFATGRRGYEVPPHGGLGTVVKPYACPADGRLSSPISDSRGYSVAYTSYVGILGDRPQVHSAYGLVPEKATPGAFNGSATLKSPPVGTRLAEITDGLSQTLLFGESPPPGLFMAGSWYTNDRPLDLLHASPPWRTEIVMWARDSTNQCRGAQVFSPGRVENLCDSFHLWSLHPGGANFALCDGSVRFLPYSAADAIPALATRAGGDVVSLD